MGQKKALRTMIAGEDIMESTANSVLPLPAMRVISSSFEEKRGRKDVVKIEVFSINDGDEIKLTFESARSPWRQGVWLRSDEYLVIDEQHSPSVQIWQDTALQEVRIK